MHWLSFLCGIMAVVVPLGLLAIYACFVVGKRGETQLAALLRGLAFANFLHNPLRNSPLINIFEHQRHD